MTSSRAQKTAAAGFCLITALYLTFTAIHRETNADAFVNYLVSLLKWTPFYWGQDRFGMILPLLAWPMRNPMANLLTQEFLHISFVLAVFFLFTFYYFEKGKWLLSGALSILIFFSISDWTTLLREFLFSSQLYSNAMFFGLLSLICARHGQRTAAILFAIVSSWCNFIMGPFFLCLVGCEILFSGRNWRNNLIEKRWQVIAITVGIVAGQVFRIPYATSESQGYLLVGMHKVFENLFTLIANKSEHSPAQLFAPPLILFAAVAATHSWRALKSFAPAYFSALLCLFIFNLFSCASQMAEWAGFPSRYLIPSVFLLIPLHIGICVEILAQKFSLLEKRRILAGVATVFSALVIFRFGPPSYEAVETSLDEILRPVGAEPVQLNCTHVVGNYYRIWPAVMYARLHGFELWGVGNRSMETRPDYSMDKIPKARICIWKDNVEEAQREMNLEHFVVIEQGESILVLTLNRS